MWGEKLICPRQPITKVSVDKSLWAPFVFLCAITTCFFRFIAQEKYFDTFSNFLFFLEFLRLHICDAIFLDKNGFEKGHIYIKWNQTIHNNRQWQRCSQRNWNSQLACCVYFRFIQDTTSLESPINSTHWIKSFEWTLHNLIKIDLYKIIDTHILNIFIASVTPKFPRQTKRLL